jgi:hypothetical protein
MSVYGNFNVKPFEDLKEQASKVFNDLIENVTKIKTECASMSDIVISDDSKLGSRWRDISEKMDQPIQTMEDTILVVKALLDAYISNTLANEEQATKELEEIDNNITILADRAETLLSGLTSLRGIGFGATAIVIPGLVGYDPSISIDPVTTSVSIEDSAAHIHDSLSEPGGSIEATTKYAPPTTPITEVTTKYAPPTSTLTEVTPVTKYAPPTSTLTEVTPVTKYAPPSDFEVVTKYAPPTSTYTEITTTTKYAPPTGLYTEITPTTKYAPPTGLYTEITPTTKYAPPTGLYTEVTTKYAPPTGFTTSSSKFDTYQVSGTGSIKPTSDTYKLNMDNDLSVGKVPFELKSDVNQAVLKDGSVSYVNGSFKSTKGSK